MMSAGVDMLDQKLLVMATRREAAHQVGQSVYIALDPLRETSALQIMISFNANGTFLGPLSQLYWSSLSFGFHE